MAIFKRRKRKIGTYSGAIAGAAAGAKIGTGIGIATGGIGIAATVPLGVIGGLLCGLAGRKIGEELDRKDWDY